MEVPAFAGMTVPFLEDDGAIFFPFNLRNLWTFFALHYIFFSKSFRPCKGCDILAQILFLALNLRKPVR